jgi:hypothetical protein
MTLGAEFIGRDVVSLEIVRYPGVENFLAVSATNHAVSHIQLGFSDAKQCVAVRAFNLHDKTLAQSSVRLILLVMLVQADVFNAKALRRKERKGYVCFYDISPHGIPELDVWDDLHKNSLPLRPSRLCVLCVK